MLYIRLVCYTCNRTGTKVLDDTDIPDTVKVGCKMCRVMVATTRPEVICAEHFIVVPYGSLRPQITVAMKKMS